MFFVANKKNMHEYRLHTLPRSGGVSFLTFLQFSNAMQTTDAKTEHRSKIVYRFEDSTQTEYQTQSDPIQISSDTKHPIEVVTCLERPTSYIHVFECTHPTPKRICSKDIRSNTFKKVSETEITEMWTYTSAVCTYVLTKSAKASTKGQASLVSISRRMPRRRIVSMIYLDGIDILYHACMSVRNFYIKFVLVTIQHEIW